jgi:hypothetical protein
MMKYSDRFPFTRTVLANARPILMLIRFYSNALEVLIYEAV